LQLQQLGASLLDESSSVCAALGRQWEWHHLAVGQHLQ